MKLKQKITLISLLTLISILTYISMLKFAGKTNFLYFLFEEWIVFIFKNKTLVKMITLVLINLSDVIVATGAGLFVGIIVKEKARLNGFFVIAGAYILRTFIVIRGGLYYDSFTLYLVEIIIMSLSIMFGIIGAYVGATLRKVLIKRWGKYKEQGVRA